MNKTSTNPVFSNRLGLFTTRDSSLGELQINSPSAFSALYDRYASVMLGVITKIVRDKNEAELLLGVVFTKVRFQISEFQPTKQPIFLWLLAIARHTALDAIKNRKALNPSAFHLATSENGTITVQTNSSTQAIDLQSKELLDKVLFGNCTPEEAAASLGIPVGSARQQLRLAMQQLRASHKLT